jgi:hypothetical protein
MSSPGNQFGRVATLVLTSPSSGLVLSDLGSTSQEPLKFKFRVMANDVDTPNHAEIRVYNASPQTVQQVIQEYTGVVLTAGYQGNLGTIFKGTVKQFRRGKENNVDSYLDILAADTDLPYNFGVINESVPAGLSQKQALQKLADVLTPGTPVDKNTIEVVTSGGIIPRGKVFFGLARAYMRDLANTFSSRWSIQQGVLTLIPNDSYIPGTAVLMNSATGMIGVPEATEQGITVKCLLNPSLQVGHLVQINNKDITETSIKQQFYPSYQDLNFIATVDGSTDGQYRIIVLEHIGDTRSQEWYSELVCLLLDPSAQPAGQPSVAPYGFPLGTQAQTTAVPPS